LEQALTVHLAVFGIVHIASRRINRFERLALLAAYLGFLFINFRAQEDNYDRQVAIMRSVRRIGEQESLPAETLLLPSNETLWIAQPDVLTGTYLGIAALAAVIILFTSWTSRNE
jgi:hypothetical protein